MTAGLPRLLIGVPVLGRPQNAAPLVANIREVTPAADVLFLCSLHDLAEIEACLDIGDQDAKVATEVMPFEAGPGDFARKHNAGFARAVESRYDWYFTGADDLRFHPDWYEQCLEAHRRSLCCVIGTLDLGNKRTMNGWHATHFLVHRDYLECGTIDEPGKLLHEGYDHQFTDDECIATARWRRTYSRSQAVVEHLHPHWQKAEMDPTYEKALRATHADMELFNSRKWMFSTAPRPSGVRP